MKISKQLKEFQLDNGSTINIMPNYIYTKPSDDLAGNNLTKSNVILIMFNKSKGKLLESTLKCKKSQKSEEIQLLKDNMFMQFQKFEEFKR